MKARIVAPRIINDEWIYCLECNWIGRAEDNAIPEMGGLLSCPACSCIDVEPWHGHTTVEIPVDLLSDILAKLCTASLMIGNPEFQGEYAQAQAQCCLNVWQQTAEFMASKGLINLEEQA